MVLMLLRALGSQHTRNGPVILIYVMENSRKLIRSTSIDFLSLMELVLTKEIARIKLKRTFIQHY